MLVTHQLESIQAYAQQKQSQDSPKSPKRSRMLLEAIIITLFAGFGTLIGLGDSLYVPVWPHLGVLLGLLFMRGIRISPWLFVGQFAGLMYAKGLLMQSIGYAGYHTFSLVLIYFLCLKLIGPVAPLSRLRVWLKFAMLTVAISFLAGYGFIYLVEYFQGKVFGLDYKLGINLCHPLSLMVFTPICLIWDTYIPQHKHTPKGPLFVVLAITAALLAVVCLSSHLIVSLVAASIALFMCIPALIVYGQLGLCWVGIMLGIALLTLIDLPGFVIIADQPYLLWWMQAALLAVLLACHGIACHRQEKQMLAGLAAMPAAQ